MPQVKIFFSNSTNTFAHIAPNLKKMPPIFFNYHIKKICPQLKNLPPFLSNSSIPNGFEKGIILTPDGVLLEITPSVSLRTIEMKISVFRRSLRNHVFQNYTV